MKDKDFKIVTEVVNGRKIKVRVPLKTISKEEFERLTFRYMKEAWERMQKEKEK